MKKIQDEKNVKFKNSPNKEPNSGRSSTLQNKNILTNQNNKPNIESNIAPISLQQQADLNPLQLSKYNPYKNIVLDESPEKQATKMEKILWVGSNPHTQKLKGMMQSWIYKTNYSNKFSKKNQDYWRNQDFSPLKSQLAATEREKFLNQPLPPSFVVKNCTIDYKHSVERMPVVNNISSSTPNQ